MPPCPRCRHDLAGHEPGCSEAGCACIHDPKGRPAAVASRPLAFGSFQSGKPPPQAGPFRGRELLRSKQSWVLVVGLVAFALFLCVERFDSHPLLLSHPRGAQWLRAMLMALFVPAALLLRAGGPWSQRELEEIGKPPSPLVGRILFIGMVLIAAATLVLYIIDR